MIPIDENFVEKARTILRAKMHSTATESFLAKPLAIESFGNAAASIDALVAVYGWTVTIIGRPGGEEPWSMVLTPPEVTEVTDPKSLVYEANGLIPLINNGVIHHEVIELLNLRREELLAWAAKLAQAEPKDYEPTDAPIAPTDREVSA